MNMPSGNVLAGFTSLLVYVHPCTLTWTENGFKNGHTQTPSRMIPASLSLNSGIEALYHLRRMPAHLIQCRTDCCFQGKRNHKPSCPQSSRGKPINFGSAHLLCWAHLGTQSQAASCPLLSCPLLAQTEH